MSACSRAITGSIGGADGIPGRHPQTQDGPQLRGPSGRSRGRRAHARERAEGAVRGLQSGLGLHGARGQRGDRALLGRAVARAAARRIRLARHVRGAGARGVPFEREPIPRALLPARQRLDRPRRETLAGAVLGHRHGHGRDEHPAHGRRRGARCGVLRHLRPGDSPRDLRRSRRVHGHRHDRDRPCQAEGSALAVAEERRPTKARGCRAPREVVMEAFYPWIVFVHVVGGFTFALAHGASAAAALRLRHERELERVRALLDLSQSASGLMYTSVVLLLTAGNGGGLVAGPLGRGWMWAAIVLLVLMLVFMYARPVPYAGALRPAPGSADFIRGPHAPQPVDIGRLNALLAL